MSTDSNDIPSFLSKHKWFIVGGGGVFFKAAGDVDKAVSNYIEALGCKVAIEKDAGIYDAWNQALDILESYGLHDDFYVAFIGLDDEIQEKFCLAVTHFASKLNKPDFIFGDNQYVLEGRCKYRTPPKSPKLFSKGPYVFDVPHPGLMNRWGAIKKSRFDLRYKLAADFDFYIGIANETNISYEKVDELQVVIGANGMSNSVKAFEIYPREWEMIESRRHVVLAVPYFKIAIFRIIAKITPLYNVLRWISWAVRANKL